MLAEPVVESCDWLAAAAPWSCRRSDDGRCDWYHGTWQYLRLINLVSNPTWHSDFFVEAIQARADAAAEPRVLVSGCADYSMLAHATAALGHRLRATVLDWCPTPLLACSWFARRHGAGGRPELVCADAASHDPAEAYDIIISDSFLPRFPVDELARLLIAWRTSLRPGGAAITTVRIHDENTGSDSARPSTVDSWRRTARASRLWWPAVSTLPVEELEERVATFAQRQERNAVYRESDLADMFVAAGFTKTDFQLVDIAGKTFARLIAT